VQRVEEESHLGGRAASILHQRDPRSDEVGDLAGPLAQNRQFAPRQVVLIERADALEEPRAGVVVEELGR